MGTLIIVLIPLLMRVPGICSKANPTFTIGKRLSPFFTKNMPGITSDFLKYILPAVIILFPKRICCIASMESIFPDAVNKKMKNKIINILSSVEILESI